MIFDAKIDFESTNFANFEEVIHNFGRSDDDMISGVEKCLFSIYGDVFWCPTWSKKSKTISKIQSSCVLEILTWVEGCLGILPLDMVDDRAWYLLQVHSLYELMTDEQQNPTYQLGIFVYFLLVLLLHMRMIVAHWWILGLFLWVEGFFVKQVRSRP